MTSSGDPPEEDWKIACIYEHCSTLPHLYQTALLLYAVRVHLPLIARHGEKGD